MWGSNIETNGLMEKSVAFDYPTYRFTIETTKQRLGPQLGNSPTITEEFLIDQ
jgi:hypothetical protein